MLVLGTVILVVVLIVAGRFYRARAQCEDMDRLNHLVERYESTAEHTTKRQETTDASLADIRTRPGEIERMMREVE